MVTKGGFGGVQQAKMNQEFSLELNHKILFKGLKICKFEKQKQKTARLTEHSEEES